MDVSQVTGSATQGIQAHHRHQHGNMNDMIDKMSSSIDDAVKAGKLTDDQAADMKKQLQEISDKLKNNPDGTGLSQDDRQEIRKELHDIGKQLRTASKPDASGNAQTSSIYDELYKKIDTNNDNKIDKDELTAFINKLTSNQQTAEQTNAQQAGYMLTIETKSTFSIMA